MDIDYVDLNSLSFIASFETTLSRTRVSLISAFLSGISLSLNVEELLRYVLGAYVDALYSTQAIFPTLVNSRVFNLVVAAICLHLRAVVA